MPACQPGSLAPCKSVGPALAPPMSLQPPTQAAKDGHVVNTSPLPLPPPLPAPPTALCTPQVWPTAQAALDEYVVKNSTATQVFVTGHSLGAAIGTLVGYAGQQYLDEQLGAGEVGACRGWGVGCRGWVGAVMGSSAGMSRWGWARWVHAGGGWARSWSAAPTVMDRPVWAVTSKATHYLPLPWAGACRLGANL